MTARRLRIAAALAALGAVAAAAVLVVLFSTAGGHRYEAEIRRTAYGIPHIQADDYGSLGYGYGYAFAQDNLCVMADRVVTLRGERSRYFGPTADANDPFADDEPTSNLTSDVYYRGMRQSGVVQRLLARPAPLGPTADLRRMVDGYVAGYNRYLGDKGVAHLPDPTCRGEAWVGPITALDVWSNVYDLNTLGGARALMAEITGARPPKAGAGSAEVPATGRADEQPAATGSNGWALGRDATRNHDGMLLANPHFPWAGYARYYQVQLTIPGVLDVAGASVSGTPVVEIGHTNRVAWTHTTSTARRSTIYELRLVPGKPTSYLVDGRPEAMTRQNVSVTVRGAGGRLSTVERTLYRSGYGPVLAIGWTPRAAFAVSDVNEDNLRSMNEWLAMGATQNVAELRAAQNKYQGIPWVNTLAADSAGTAYFADASVVPHVTDDQARHCIDTPQGRARYPETFVLDGSRSACNWGSDEGAVRPGIFAPRRMPQLTRTDYVANSNNSPWLSNPAAPITGYPAIFGGVGTDADLRARLGLDMIARRLAGTDGLGPAGFTLPTLQATMFGNRNYSADLARADVVAMCRAHPVLTASDEARIDVRAACDVLAAWNGSGGAGSRAEGIWELFFHPTSPDWWRVPFDRAHPLTTPRGIDGDNPDVQRSFADAVEFLQGNQAPRSPRWAGITLPGCPGERGCFNVIEASDATGRLINAGPGQGPPLPPTGVRRPSDKPPSIFGSSFIMAVELTPQGPRARTLLTYSESANPKSSHHTDQTVLFARGRWITERFSETEIAADPSLQTTTLHGSARTGGGGGRLGLERNEGSSSSSATTPADMTAAGDRTWKKVAPSGDCECADGSEFAFWERRADPTKVVFFLDGGGVCFDAQTCAFTGLNHPGKEAEYDWSIWGEDPAHEGGIFDFARADNPFRDYSFIYVPSCTGDTHLGDVTRKYSAHLTVEHKGFVNGRTSLRYLADHYPGAAQVVVVGKSVGSIAAPVYGGLAADLLPDARVIVFGAQSSHIPNRPAFNAKFFGELWGAYANMPDWEVNRGLTARDWGPTRFWIQASLHDPDIVLARFDYAYDREAAKEAASLGLDPSRLLSVIDANEAAIEKAGAVLHSYTAPGHDHGILEWPRFYELKVNGERLVDWVRKLIEGRPLDGVHCRKCRVG